MTIGELKQAIAGLDNRLEIEIIARYEDGDGDEIDLSCNLDSIRAGMDADTAGKYARFECSEHRD
jgi:hypothetical protein